MRSYTKVVVADNGEIFTATFAKRFGVAGTVKRWQHDRDQNALQLANFLITLPYIVGFSGQPLGLSWTNNVTQVNSASGPQLLTLGYTILPFDSHPLN